MRKIAALFMALLMIATPLSVFNGIASASEPAPVSPFAGGSGTAADPYIIENVWELQNMSLDLGANYSLGNDIDASITAGWNSGAGFVPVGDGISRFNGSFDGDGHFIFNLYINQPSPSGSYIGLFGCTNVGVEIHDVHLFNYSVIASDYAGGLIGANYGNVTNCSASGIIQGNNDDVGGLIGLNNGGTVKTSYSAGTVSADQRVGGLIGFSMANGKVFDSYSTASASGTSPVGGFIGWNAGPLTNCYSTGQVTGSGGSVGGLLGINGDIVTNCFWDNGTSGQATSAGPETGLNTSMMMYNMIFITAGWDMNNIWWMVSNETRPFLRMEYDTTIRNSHQVQLMGMDLNADYTLANDIDLAGTMVPSDMWGTGPSSGMGFSSVGGPAVIDRFKGSLEGHGHIISNLFYNTTNHYNGILAYTDTGSRISNITVTTQGTVTGNTNNGILAGDVMGDLFNCHVIGSINGSDYTGGMTGYQGNGISYNCSAQVNVTGTSPVGGYAGASDVNTIDTYATGTVYGSGNQVGGLVGEYWTGTINNSGFSGSVTGGDNTGGLVGYSGQGTITGCVADAEVNGAANVGGLIGQAWDSSITLCDSLGNSTGTLNNIGGLVGLNEGIINNTYSQGAVSGNSQVGGLVGNNTGTVNDSYSSGAVSGTGSYIGGLAGLNWGTITECHWDNETSGWTTSAGGIGNSTTEMMQQATFAGWDFTNIWGIYETNTYPFLRALGPTYVPQADLALSMAVSPSPIAQNGSYVYVYVNVTNNGPDNAANVNVTLTGSGADMWPNDINSTSIVQWDSGASWYPGTLGPGETSWLLINLTANESGMFYLNGTSHSDENDPVPGNNNASISVDINAAPIAVDDPNHIIDEDAGPINMDVLINDNDPDGDPLTVINVTPGQHGTVAIIDSGKNVTYAPDADWNGDDWFNYTISDGRGGTDTATVNITVLAIDDATVAVDDAFSIVEDSGANQLDVLANDYDVDGDPITVSGIQKTPEHGTVEITPDGLSVNYAPDTNFTGTDTFNYTTTGGSGTTNRATVTITVTPVEDAPIAQGDGATLDEDTVVTIDVLANDLDADGDTLTITAVTQPANGTAAIIDNGRNITYTPAPDWYGSETFTYTISDGTSSANGTVSITVTPVNDPPVIHTTALPDGTVGEAYEYHLNITDVDDDIYAPTFTVNLQTNAGGHVLGSGNGMGPLQQHQRQLHADHQHGGRRQYHDRL